MITQIGNTHLCTHSKIIHLMKRISIAAFSILFCVLGNAQQSDDARMFLRKAIHAATGNNTLKTVRYHSNVFRYLYNQSFSPDMITPLTVAGTVAVDLEKGLFNAESYGTFPGG